MDSMDQFSCFEQPSIKFSLSFFLCCLSRLSFAHADVSLLLAEIGEHVHQIQLVTKLVDVERNMSNLTIEERELKLNR